MIADFKILLKYFFKEDIRKANQFFLLPLIEELTFNCFLNPVIVFLLTIWFIPSKIMWLCLLLNSATFLVVNLGASVNKINTSFLFYSLKILGVSQILLLIVFDLKFNIYKFLGTLLLLIGLIYKMNVIPNIFILLTLLFLFISARIYFLNYLIKKKKNMYFLSGIDHYLDYFAVSIGILLALNNIKMVFLILFVLPFLHMSVNLIKKYMHLKNYNFLFLQKLILELKIGLYEMDVPIVNAILAIIVIAGFGLYIIWMYLNANSKLSPSQFLNISLFGTTLFQTLIFDHYCFFPLTETSDKKMRNLRFLGDYILERYRGKLKIYIVFTTLFLLIICLLELSNKYCTFFLLYFSILLSLGESCLFFYSPIIFQEIVCKLPIKFRRMFLIIPGIFSGLSSLVLLKILDASISMITKISIGSSLIVISIFILIKLAHFSLKESDYRG
ncbi:MAG: hypothetical protein LBT69_04765 [Lactobacillales bacterium]|nr:hypothetical protein [Lactobacillales bacterium]